MLCELWKWNPCSLEEQSVLSRLSGRTVSTLKTESPLQLPGHLGCSPMLIYSDLQSTEMNMLCGLRVHMLGEY